MNKLQLSRVLMVAAIVLLAAFQGYWLNKLYKDEYQSLRKEVDVSFREAMNKLQTKRFERDSSLVEHTFNSPAQIAIRTKDKNEQSLQLPKPSKAFLYRTIDLPAKIKNIPADSIESVSVKTGFSFKGAPPPELINLILKQKLASLDSGRMVIRIDSAYNATFDNGGKEKSRHAVWAFNISSSDSLNLRSFPDSAPKLTKRFFPVTVTTVRKSVDTNSTTAFNTTRLLKRRDSPVVDRIIFNNQNPVLRKGSPIITFLTNNKTINDSIPVKSVDSAYRAELAKRDKQLSFNILFKSYTDSGILNWNREKVRDSSGEFVTEKVFVGYNTPYSYQAKFNNTGAYVLKQMQLQISSSILLLLFVIGTFVLMYRNLMAQQRLTNIKNDFISNITHELKTPIATVGVAIEALRNFNAIQSPERTKEYLDISASELQRLGLLVDKVLKLSMFEKKQIELNKEPFDLKELVAETLHTMKLQFEKNEAQVDFTYEDESFMVEADKLHITSVVYNLLDNALKYAKGQPVIQVALKRLNADQVQLTVSDNGMGISPQHQLKIFDKFFRVPTGNQHNIKGYGLGLSYVAEVLKSHHGYITVSSELDKGSTFVVTLPDK